MEVEMKISGKCKAKDLILAITEAWGKAKQLEANKGIDFHTTVVV